MASQNPKDGLMGWLEEIGGNGCFRLLFMALALLFFVFAVMLGLYLTDDDRQYGEPNSANREENRAGLPYLAEEEGSYRVPEEGEVGRLDALLKQDAAATWRQKLAVSPDGLVSCGVNESSRVTDVSKKKLAKIRIPNDFKGAETLVLNELEELVGGTANFAGQAIVKSSCTGFQCLTSLVEIENGRVLAFNLVSGKGAIFSNESPFLWLNRTSLEESFNPNQGSQLYELKDGRLTFACSSQWEGLNIDCFDDISSYSIRKNFATGELTAFPACAINSIGPNWRIPNLLQETQT